MPASQCLIQCSAVGKPLSLGCDQADSILLHLLLRNHQLNVAGRPERVQLGCALAKWVMTA